MKEIFISEMDNQHNEPIRVRLIQMLRTLPPNIKIFTTLVKDYTCNEVQDELVKNSPLSQLFIHYILNLISNDTNKLNNPSEDLMGWID